MLQLLETRSPDPYWALLIDSTRDFHPQLQWNLLPLILWISRNALGQEISFWYLCFELMEVEVVKLYCGQLLHFAPAVTLVIIHIGGHSVAMMLSGE